MLSVVLVVAMCAATTINESFSNLLNVVIKLFTAEIIFCCKLS